MEFTYYSDLYKDLYMIDECIGIAMEINQMFTSKLWVTDLEKMPVVDVLCYLCVIFISCKLHGILQVIKQLRYEHTYLVRLFQWAVKNTEKLKEMKC